MERKHLPGSRRYLMVKPNRRDQSWRLHIRGGNLRFTPLVDVIGIDQKTEQVRGNESPLPGVQANQAKNNAVDCSQHPALPQTLAHHHGGSHGQQTRNIIQMQHADVRRFSEFLNPFKRVRGTIGIGKRL